MADLTWIELADFRPGIFSDYGAQASATKLPSGKSSAPANGAATPENTWRCHADPRTGALVPLPARSAGTTQTLIPEGNARTAPAYYPAASGACAWVMDGVAFARDGATDAVNVIAAFGFNYATAGGGSNYVGYLLTRMWRPDGIVRDLAFQRHAVAGQGTVMRISASLEKTRTAPNASDDLHPSLGQLYSVGGVLGNIQSGLTIQPASGTMSAADQALTTYDTDASTTYVSGATTDPWLQLWPNVNTPTSGIPTFAFGLDDAYAPILVGHQGRLVALANGSGAFGAAGFAAIEHLVYTKVDRHGDGTSTTLFIAHEAPGGYGTAHSLNANELFLVKHLGGAILIRGDLDYPEVVRLPLVESTHSVHTRGAATPIGFVYGSRHGVYVWSGGDTSKRLSEQLDGFFWRHELDQSDEPYTGIQRARFGWWDPFVAVAGNWLFDTRGGGWWRLEEWGDPASNSNAPMPMHCFDIGPDGKLYAFHYKLTSTWNTVWSAYDRDVKASSYSWQSQPLIETRDRLVTPRELELIAQPADGATGAQTVTITVTGVDKNGAPVAAATETFTLTGLGPDPVYLRRDGIGAVHDLNGVRYVRIRIQASAASGPAPKVLAVRLGVRDSVRVAAA